MKIISLVDNIKNRDDLSAEHGLSFYIETKKHKLLFDLGASDLFLTNAEKLGVDIKQVDTVVISHGHDDHGGGLNAFLSYNDKAKIYISSLAFNGFYSEKEGNCSYIGLDQTIKNNNRLLYINDFNKVDEGLTLFSKVDSVFNRFASNKNLKKKINDTFVEDDFLHEVNLILTEENKKVLIAGCSHTGIDNIVNRFYDLEEIFPKAVFGGLHLMKFNNEDDKDTALSRVQKTAFQSGSIFYTCHCTGEESYNKLKSSLKDQIVYFYLGEKIII